MFPGTLIGVTTKWFCGLISRENVAFHSAVVN